MFFFQEKEVRLFDKGEMNTCRDELYFVSVVSNHMKMITQRPEHPQPSQELAKQISDQLHEIVNSLEKELQENKVMSVKDAFTNQSEYQNSVCSIGRKLTFCKVAAEISQVKQEMKQKVEELKSRVGNLYPVQNIFVEELVKS